ncbi:MAG: hypothetical protein ACJ71M_16115 [Nitrososphaeraceae archaeon]
MTSDGTTAKQIVFYSYYTATTQTAVNLVMRLYNDFENKEVKIRFDAAYEH